MHPKDISIHDFSYELPPERIAVYPLAQRDQSKLLIFRDQTIHETVFSELGHYLNRDTVLVFNATRVIRARLGFQNEKGQPVEIFCLSPEDESTDPSLAMSSTASCRWSCLVGNLKKWTEGDLCLRAEGFSLFARLLARRAQHVSVEFYWEPSTMTFSEVLERSGQIPIPPYLKRDSDLLDQERYQTIYARSEGSVAAPTAGLHFTEPVMKQLEELQVGSLTVTLHVGAGTFRPVKSDTMQEHEMHAEWMEVSRETLVYLREHPEKKIVAVGTTSLRTLESLYWMGAKAFANPGTPLADLEVGQWDPYEADYGTVSVKQSLEALIRTMDEQGVQKLLCQTRILIAPPYALKIAGGIVTNFHQPQSTLLLLVSAVAGEKWREIYRYALDHGFRFLSYGDSSLLLK